MSATHTDRAVRAVHAYFEPAALGDGSGFEAFLRAYETRAGLAASTLPNPVDYVRGAMPNDTRGPLFRVFDTSVVPSGAAGQRNHLSISSVTISVAYTSDADVLGAEDIMRAFLSSMIQAIEADGTLGGRANNVMWTVGSRAEGTLQDRSQIRHVRALDLRVNTYDP